MERSKVVGRLMAVTPVSRFRVFVPDQAFNGLEARGLSGLKVDELLDPLRKEPRFREIEHKLRIPA